MGGTAGSTLTTWLTSTTVYWLKLETARKLCSGAPWASLNRVVPSRRIPGPMENGTEEHMLFASDAQLGQVSHCPKNVGTTVSPTANSSTCSPILSTTLKMATVQSEWRSILRIG